VPTLWGEAGVYAVFALCAMTAISLRAQTFTTLYSFCPEGAPCPDGAKPTAGLVQAADGDLYGTTSIGGANCPPFGCGTVFKITLSGTLTTLYSFCLLGTPARMATPRTGWSNARMGTSMGPRALEGQILCWHSIQNHAKRHVDDAI
jgi:uncharacterized repeat protein (TIGR03803 family)